MSTLLEPHAMAESSDPPKAAEEPCYLLEKLPAELRNNIYELAFTSDDEVISYDAENRPDCIDLCTATPPSKNLILTCREIYQEANKMYKAMYREYWTENSFIIQDKDGEPNRAALEALHEEDLLHIGSLEINCQGDPENEYDTVYHLTENKTGWELGWWEGKNDDEWRSEIFARDKYEVNPHSRVGAMVIGWDNFWEEEELDAAAAAAIQDSEQRVSLRTQVLILAMQHYEEGDRWCEAANDDSWRGKYCEELPLANK